MKMGSNKKSVFDGLAAYFRPPIPTIKVQSERQRTRARK